MPPFDRKTPEVPQQAPSKELANRLSNELFYEFLADHPETEAGLFNHLNEEEKEKIANRAIGIIEDKVHSFLVRNEPILLEIIASAQKEKRADVRELVKEALKEITREIIDGVCSTMEMETESKTDSLTQLPNRRAFDEKLKEEIARESRNGPFCILIIDLDHFKGVNDTHGHLAGDEVLRSLGQKFNDIRRTSDFYARYGGEEFVVILTNTPEEKAYVAAHRISKAVKEMTVNATDKQGNPVQIPVSASVAGAAFKGYKEDPIGKQMIESADRSLYVLKGLLPDIEGVKKNRRGMVVFNEEVISNQRAEAIAMRQHTEEALNESGLTVNGIKRRLDERESLTVQTD